MNLDELNDLCREIAEETMTENVDNLVAELEDAEYENYLLSVGPRAFGDDPDENYGPYPWELK